jgi:hypothetical protein
VRARPEPVGPVMIALAQALTDRVGESEMETAHALTIGALFSHRGEP